MTRFMAEIPEAIENLSKTLRSIHYSELLLRAEEIKMRQSEEAAEPFFKLAVQFKHFVDRL